MSVRELLIARQPVFDRHLETAAYELRYGQPGGHAGAPSTQDAERFLDTILDLGLDQLVGARAAIVAFPPSFLSSSLPELVAFLPADRLMVLVELPDYLRSDVRDALRRLAHHGCQILLGLDLLETHLPSIDDVDAVRVRLPDPIVLQEQRIRLEALLAELLAPLASFRSGTLRVLVSDIRTYHEFVVCRDFGVDLFQGPFLFRPLIVREYQRPVSDAALLLLSRLADPAIDFEEIERLLAQDVQLTYKLLKLVNSVWFARRSRIDSLRQALLVLGIRNVAAWVTVLVLAGIENKPVELVRTAVLRARLCELLAAATGSASRETAFLTGLLSVLDAALDRPLEAALAPLPLASEVVAALLEQRGPLGRLLQLVRAYESGDWPHLADLPLAASVVTEAHIDVLAFTAEVLGALEEAS
ncbi:MAG: HDOD domain-containing protein [Thermomicrobium sp.]|uniref:EAL and HDOD domain-containing protein n=1 Tax=Thermomicrobium sp. TaxID=1969469 RepID=UPI001B2B3C1F|nr:HDOD domain-containing protein [Thermomicrobium sp.]MBO9351704.1 HDOD domain-containing protein [Thermomicrobium sp.]